MNENRDLQHPAITQAESTGYPFPRKTSVTVTEELAKGFCREAFDLFWYQLMICSPSAVTQFLDTYHQEFDEYICQT